ncbi:DUF4280 domain-containing protein [Pedobacter sp. MR2016-19]|uniref:GH-E family nuclease n=1 Tax=Pedobacter sp. MR2016-19 TaxID=2780089 RepID=UPI001874BC32|nr:GH-E family nuclease [Pedobacter sp. MR2016-19]MBE5322127.1 DUF4280 domain-containing protein [Pedobacter sp. MR2016-19]
MMQCTNGGAPGLFTPTYNQTTKINSCLVSTNNDKIPITNIPSFVVCKKTQKPCVPVSTEWQDTYPVKVKSAQTLIGQSCMTCGIGGKIEFLTSGQVPLSPEEESELNEMRDGVKKNFEAEQKEKNKPWWQKAGEFVVDCVPVIGPIVSLVKNVSEGNWGMALLDVGFLALDVVGVAGAPFTGGASLAGSTVAKVGIKQAIKAGARQVAKKLSKEALEAAAKQTARQLEKLSVRSLTKGKLCVFACFPAGTPIAVKDALKNIEEIIPGEEIWAWSENKKDYALKKVTRIIESETDILVRLTVNGETIDTTPTHPFYSKGEWVDAGALEPGDMVMLFDGTEEKIKSVDYVIENEDYDDQEIDFSSSSAPDAMDLLSGRKKIKVYNFEVEDYETFHVGKQRILVHNGRICLKNLTEDAIKKIRTEMLEKGYRPKYRKGQVQKVWDKALKKGNGKVKCPNTGKTLKWNKKKNRFDQWHMGHTKDSKWSKTVKDYKDGKITWKELLDKHGDHKNYVPEDPVGNMSHMHE